MQHKKTEFDFPRLSHVFRDRRLSLPIPSSLPKSTRTHAIVNNTADNRSVSGTKDGSSARAATRRRRPPPDQANSELRESAKSVIITGNKSRSLECFIFARKGIPLRSNRYLLAEERLLIKWRFNIFRFKSCCGHCYRIP